MPSFLHPEHAISEGEEEDEEEEEEEEDEVSGGEGSEGDAYGTNLDSEQTEVLLRQLFHHYSNDDNANHMSAGKFYKVGPAKD